MTVADVGDFYFDDRGYCFAGPNTVLPVTDPQVQQTLTLPVTEKVQAVLQLSKYLHVDAYLDPAKHAYCLVRRTVNGRPCYLRFDSREDGVPYLS